MIYLFNEAEAHRRQVLAARVPPSGWGLFFTLGRFQLPAEGVLLLWQELVRP